MNMWRKFFLIVIGLCPVLALAQKKNESYQLNITKASTAPIVDGNDDDQVWKECAVANDFFMVLPMDTSKAAVQTEVRMTYDNDNIYIVATCFHGGWKYMVESLRRDWNFGRNDNFIFFMDTFEDQTNGFAFGANSAGAQWDGMMYEGGKVDLSWDNKWTSASTYSSDRWVFEASIPFKSLRYKKGISKWGINFSRQDLRTTEKSSWAPVPRQFPTASLAYTGVLVWDQPPPSAGANVSLIPYLLGGASKDYENKKNTDYRGGVGGDAKIALTSSINLDLTINPDFSQVEVDRQVTNLERFELFFPERRQFFLENGDLFGNFGYQSVRPFFSRRIGLVQTGPTKYEHVPIAYGARISGKLNRNWRVGGMYMKTKKDSEFGLPGQHFSTFAIQRKVFSRSNIGLIFVNRDSEDSISTGTQVVSKYNRNLGIEYNLASANNYWTGKMLFLKSFSPNVSGKDFVQAGNLTYFSRKWNITMQYEYVGENYNAEVGFLPRKGYLKVNPQITKLFFPKGGKILSHGPLAMITYYRNDTIAKIDNEMVAAYNMVSRKRSTVTFWVARNFLEILTPVDPTNSGKPKLPLGSTHFWTSGGFDFLSKPQSRFTYSVSSRYGGYYYSSTRFNFTTELGYRFQPYAAISVNASYNDIKNLPLPWGRTKFWLISPRLDVTLTNKFFLTAFTQYNEQSNNVNLNARLQWRYKPASDFFIVYTDNYFPETFYVRNRALVVKWTYWWNL
jgi:Domain of unknown function (DUF5916)